MTKSPVVFPPAISVFTDLRLLLAFGFGSGLSRIMPGTMGTLASLPFWYALALLPMWAYIAILVAASVVGNYLCGYAANKLKVHDHGGIVWDEFVGMWICLIGIGHNAIHVLVGFVLFRIFDMVKPWPISLADKHLGGGFGIMFDDVLAGFAALACLQGLIVFGGI
ncbi:MAG: phosphatidylglycerophosphatase A [Flavobacteriales bacterium]|jgi:phosphatidylglycerophosphatase A